MAYDVTILPRYLTIDQIVAYTGFSESFFEKLRKDGRGPAWCPGYRRKGIRYKIDDVDAWMEHDKVQTIDSISRA